MQKTQKAGTNRNSVPALILLFIFNV